MIYWFQRKKDNEYIPIEGEQAAWKMYSRVGFNQSFVYLGRSSGQIFKEVIAQSKVKRFSKDEAGKIFNGNFTAKSEKLAKQQAETVREAVRQEIEAMLKNPDKTKPRNFNFTDAGNNPIQDPVLLSTLRGLQGGA